MEINISALHKQKIKCPHCAAPFAHHIQLKKHVKFHCNAGKLKSYHEQRKIENSPLSPLPPDFCTICGTLVSVDKKQPMDQATDSKFTTTSCCNLLVNLPFECLKCGDLFEDLKQFQDHFSGHSSERIYTFLPANNGDVFCGQNAFWKRSPSISEKDFVTHNTAINKKENLHNQELAKNLNNFDNLMENNHAKEKLTRQVNNNSFQCNKCGKEYTLAHSLFLHNQKKHSKTQFFKSSELKKDYVPSNDNKDTHMHDNERPFTCDWCGLCFILQRNLEQHKKVHVEGKYKCEFCSREYNLKTSLLNHIEKHKGEEVCFCPQCKAPYSNKNDLRLHKKRDHKSVPQNKCNVCDKIFLKKSELIKHSRLHSDEKPFLCKICGKRFSHQTSLSNHKVVHSGEKPYQCAVCGKSFGFSGNLNIHLRTHTGEKPHECAFCRKRFARSANLKEHMKTHTGEKSYKCEFCEKTFRGSSGYVKHKKIHTGERPFSCPVCNNSFTQMVHLSKHILTHTGEKPFQCSICKKYYRRKDTLRIHARLHEKKSSETTSNTENKCPLQNK